MGRNPEYFRWEEILNIFNGKKFLIFSMEKINIFTGKQSSTFSVERNLQYTPNTDSYTAKRFRTVQRSNGLLVLFTCKNPLRYSRERAVQSLLVSIIYFIQLFLSSAIPHLYFLSSAELIGWHLRVPVFSVFHFLSFLN